MGTVHRLIEAQGKAAAIQSGVDRGVVEAASTYMSDEDSSLSFAFSGWAQCALPHRRLPDDQRWKSPENGSDCLLNPDLGRARMTARWNMSAFLTAQWHG
jgi:hypothetical protein